MQNKEIFICFSDSIKLIHWTNIPKVFENKKIKPKNLTLLHSKFNLQKCAAEKNEKFMNLTRWTRTLPQVAITVLTSIIFFDICWLKKKGENHG